MSSFLLEYALELEFPSSKDAEYVMKAIAVDKNEYESSEVEMSVVDSKLACKVRANTYRVLRLSTTSLFEFLILSVRTLRAFR